MAINKRKVLDAARKYAQKGAKGKALKEYYNLLKRDPHDAKLRLEIGDCNRRWGQVEEAITQYARVAEQYKDDGFDARAVAVFKQILNLDSKRYDAYVSLSELYQRMGLDSEALSALQTAADAHHKEGNQREALELLRKMATLDPTNTTSRLKVAELLRQEGLEDDAVAEYRLAVAELERQGASESIVGVEQRILELKPDQLDVLTSIGRRHLQLGKPDRAEEFVKRALEQDPEESDAHEILIEIYQARGDDEGAATTAQALAKIYRDRGDEDRSRELTQRGFVDLELESAFEEAPEQAEPAALDEDEALQEDSSAADFSETSDTSDELASAEEDGIELELVSEAEPEELVLEETDEPEIDLAEEDVAGEDLEDGASDSAPEGDSDQLLAEATVYLRYGKREEAIESLEVILEREPEQRAALEKLGEAHAEGDERDKAVELWSLAATRARAEGDEEAFSALRDRISSLDADAAFALDQARVEPAVDDEAEFAPEDQVEFEIDLSDEHSDDGIEIDLSPEEEEDGEQASPGLDEEQAEEISSASDDAETPVPSVGHSSATTSLQVSEDLEEAEFYFQQDLFDEAEAVYRRILMVAPNHPSALVRLGEIAAAKGDDPSTVADSGSGAQASDSSVSGDYSCAEDTVPLEQDFEEPEVEQAEEPEADEALALDAEEDEGGFDLAAELRDVIDEVEEADSTDSGVLSTVGDGIETILADFKQGVTATLSEDDYETRYDLGIAYREMELYDDAIGEFQVCLASPSLMLGSLHMMGLCALDLGRAADATNHLEQALATPDLPDEQAVGLRFDLARALEGAGDMGRARSTYQSVIEIDPGFPGVAERLESLGEAADAPVELLDDESECFENFDDIVAEVEAEDRMTEEAENFENFDGEITVAEPEKAAPEKKPRRKKISFV